MSKIYIVISSGGSQPLAPIASVIASDLRERGWTKVSTEHGPASERTVQLLAHRPKIVLSEHYTNTPLSFEVGEVVRTFTEADKRLMPPLTIFTGNQLLGISVIGPVNSGKSWIIRMIQEIVKKRFELAKTDVIEEYMPGTWGWLGNSDDFVNDGMMELQKKVEIDVRILEAPRRSRLGDQLSLTD